ncbi:hypothetical protein M427DRAFT_151969 [Gonapodya prolifera JEL478]|uniref:ARM repeat-containing protein n=1 Tax=Gonapodya prolifera (strain JEL478) TaxID=1344416 RepID=A0A139ATF2_GONPJ|nr:hypothetical protein M427DRAFT_151969 [Gonapodya prolifera JEL478]|eukprot:KXS20002.1 hypothetical protein M427DRAFT_151969 [Gonapodya prolifera JEL478]
MSHNGMSDPTLLQVMEALDVLYSRTHPPSPQTVAQCNRFLVNVQKHHLAWDLAAHLLNVGWYGDPNPGHNAYPLVLLDGASSPQSGTLRGSGNVNYMFFAAHTWAVKLSRDWDTLGTSNGIGVYTKFQDPRYCRDMLLSWMIRLAFVGRRAPRVVLNKLMAAVVTFALRAPPSYFPDFPSSFASLCFLASTQLVSSAPTTPAQLHAVCVSTCQALFPSLYDSSLIGDVGGGADGRALEPAWPILLDPTALEPSLRNTVAAAVTTQFPSQEAYGAGAMDVVETLVRSIFDFVGSSVEEVRAAELVGARKTQVVSATTTSLPITVRLASIVLQVCTPPTHPVPENPRRDAAVDLVGSAAKFLEVSVGWGLETSTLAALPPDLIPYLLVCPTLESVADSSTFGFACEALTSILGAKACSQRIATSVINSLWGPRETGRSWARSLVLEAKDGGDPSTLAPLISLVAQLGESYSSLFAQCVREMGQPSTTSAEVLMVVQDLLETALAVSDWPGFYPEDEDVSQRLLPFWSYFAESISELEASAANDEPEESQQVTRQMQRASGPRSSTLSALISVLARKSSYPIPYSRFQGSPDIVQEQWKTYRTDAGDSAVAVAGAVRGEVVGWLVTGAVATMDEAVHEGGEGWQPLESMLHLLRYVAEEIPPRESETVPRIFTELVARILQWQQPEGNKRLRLAWVKVRYQTIMLCGAYSEWLQRHPSHLPLVVNLLVGGLAHSELAPAAASSLKNLCDNCRLALADGVDWLVGVYLETARAIQLLERTRVIEAVASVIQALPPSSATPYITQILTNVVGGIQGSLNALSVSTEPSAAEFSQRKLEICNGLNELIAFIKGVREVESIEISSDEEDTKRGSSHRAPTSLEGEEQSRELVLGTWNVVELIARKFVGDPTVSDTLCVLFTTVVRFPSASFPLLKFLEQPLNALVAELFCSVPKSNLLECAKVIVSASGSSKDDPNVVSSCVRLVQVLTERVATIITSEAAVEDQPAIVQCFFDLLTQSTRSLPVIILSLSAEAADYIFMKLVPTALTAQEKLAAKSVVIFLGEFFGKDVDGGELSLVVRQVVSRIGADVVRELLVNLAGRSPRFMVQAITECLYKLCIRYPEATRAALIQCLGQEGFPNTRVDAAAKQQFVKEIMTSRQLKRFQEIAKNFSLKCRGLENTAFGAVV